MKRRVLIISPRFPPTNAPDHQRVRMALPYLQEFGWNPTVLAVRPEYVEGGQDYVLGSSVSGDARIIRVPALPVRWTRKLGLGGLTYRALPYLKPRAERLLREENFDLVFFSTTEFMTMSWGRGWKSQFGVPYVLDFQDPWVNDHYKRNVNMRRPGGNLKHALTQWLARQFEPGAVRDASHSICVSPGYPGMLRARYPDVEASRFTVLPFAAANTDFEFLRRNRTRQELFDPGDGKRHWVYVGRGGDDMDFSLRCLFTAVNKARAARMDGIESVVMHFIGTDYAAGSMARKSVEARAKSCGVGDMVHEHPWRVPYFTSLQCLLDADALVVTGSSDANYTASKIYPYILANRPMLTVFHENSSVNEVIRSTRAGTAVTFGANDSVDLVAEKIVKNWIVNPSRLERKVNWAAFEPYTAKRMTQRMSEVFHGITEITCYG